MERIICSIFKKKLRQNRNIHKRYKETNKNLEYYYTQNGSVIWATACETSRKWKVLWFRCFRMVFSTETCKGDVIKQLKI